ncbi:glycoside hydrolase family 78 protein [Leifsonia kafniensis]|uniref:alpha-L-rhamnosidase n=1 Tax=Leifsonia kafniensis TaxID=475957 RepID=A0ABP7JZR6_9MICO
MPSPAALFIGPPSPAAPDAPALYTRREFDVAATITRATLKVTALGIVEPFINGVRVGDEVLAPGWTSYRHRIAVSTYDVTEMLEEGPNAVAAVIGDGWAVGRLGMDGARAHYSDRPAVYLELTLEYPDETVTIGSGDSFRISTGGVQANGIYDGETYDARREPEGWKLHHFDDSQWDPAHVVEWDLGTLEPATASPIRRIEELSPARILTTPSGCTVVDFGQNISGWVRIDVNGHAGDTVTLRHAEILTPQGELEPQSNRTAAATDRYILRGNGPESWEPRFTFHGFRFVEVEGWPGTLTPESIRAVVVHSDMERTGWFETSDPLLNQLHSNVVWSMRGNFVGIPTDCPQRDERLGWTGDINAFAPTASFLYDVRGVLGAWLHDLAAEQQEKGEVPWTVPDILAGASHPTALWGDVAVNLPWTLFQEYGDINILRRSYTSMTAFVDQVTLLLNEDGLWDSGFQWGDWLDPDAPVDNPFAAKTDKYLVASAYFCRTTRQMAQTAELLGEENDAQRYAALADRVRNAFCNEWVTPNGRIVDEATTAVALAIAFDILSADQRGAAGDRLAELVRKAGYRISTGFAGTPLVAHALSSTGNLDTAYRLLTEKSAPSFLYPVTMGATTIWERWDSVLPDGTFNDSGMTSLNHYALGAIADWMHRVVGGLSPIEPGYRRARIAPQPGGGLTSAKLTHTTVLGTFRVAWSIDGGTLTLDIDVPDGAGATVELPEHPESAVHEVKAGHHHWSYQIPTVQVESGPLTMNSTMTELAEHPTVWAALNDVFETYFPGHRFDAHPDETAGLTLATLLQYIPGASEELAADFERALTIPPTASCTNEAGDSP